MSETNSHKRAKGRAPGVNETRISRGRRLDSASPKRATEIERSGNPKGLEKAARRLHDSGKPQRVLQVPQKDMSKATDAMRKTRTSGTVKNMSGSKRRSV